MKFISVIPARSGSKGIKNKNIYPLKGTPLVSYTFREVTKSNSKKNFILTDSKTIKKIAKKFKINSEYNRPSKLSQSNTSLSETLFHFYNWAIKKSLQFDYLIVLQPTSPLRNYKDINKAIQIIKNFKYKSLFSISESLEHPYEVVKVSGKRKWSHILKKSKNFFRRQDFDIKTFFINGAIYIIHKDLIKKKKIYDKKKHCFLKMPKERSIEINDLSEAKIVERLIEKK